MKKTLKIIATVILTIAIVIASVASFATAALRGTVLNPNLYKKTLVNIGAYDELYDAFSDLTLKYIDDMELPEELQDVPNKILHDAVSKAEFNQLVGDFIGGTTGWLLYNQEEQDVPLRYIITEIETAINENETIAEDDSNLNEILLSAMTNKLETYLTPDDYGDTLRSYVFYYLSGDSVDFQNRLDTIFNLVYFLGYNLNIYMWILLAATLILIVLLFLLHRKDIKYPATLMQIISVFFSVICFVAAIGLLFAVPILSNVGPLQSHTELLPYVSPITTTLGVVAIFNGVLYSLLAIIFVLLKRNIKREPNESN